MTWKVVLGELELVRGVGVVGDLCWGLIVHLHDRWIGLA